MSFCYATVGHCEQARRNMCGQPNGTSYNTDTELQTPSCSVESSRSLFMIVYRYSFICGLLGAILI